MSYLHCESKKHATLHSCITLRTYGQTQAGFKISPKHYGADKNEHQTTSERVRTPEVHDVNLIIYGRIYDVCTDYYYRELCRASHSHVAQAQELSSSVRKDKLF